MVDLLSLSFFHSRQHCICYSVWTVVIILFVVVLGQTQSPQSRKRKMFCDFLFLSFFFDLSCLFRFMRAESADDHDAFVGRHQHARVRIRVVQLSQRVTISHEVYTYNHEMLVSNDAFHIVYY